MRNSSRRRLVVLLLVTFAVTAVLPAERTHAADDLSPAKVLAAIKQGREYLISQQRANGSWPGFDDSYPGGVTSLAVLALINSGMTPKDTAVKKGLQNLRRQALPEKTYAAGLMIMALAAAKDSGDKSRIISLVAKLEKGQITRGRNTGSWSYGLGGGGGIGGGDRSNAQFAILGLRDAVHAGVKVKRETWVRVRQHWTSQQSPNGSWSYASFAGGGHGSMTVAGIATMVITSRMLNDGKEVDANGRPVCCNNAKPDIHLAKAVKWLGDQMNRGNTVIRNFGRGGNLLYYLYGLERAGRLSGRRFFGSKDWYREGVRYFVNQQTNLQDGSWRGRGGLGENQPIVGTSMVLLFLSKGLAPVLINKLKYGPQHRFLKNETSSTDWNLHPHDTRNLTDYVITQEKWPKLLTWQTVEMQKLVNHGGDIEALDQAKVLLITGSEHIKELLEPSQTTILKNYIKRGGFIFVVGNCDPKSKFDAGFKELVKKMFPNKEAELKRLQPDHPVYRSEFRLARNKVEYDKTVLYGVDFGCRTAMIYAPVGPEGFDVSCLWAKWMPQEPPTRDPRVKPLIDRAMQIGINVVAYATGREPPQKLQSLGPKTDKGRNDRLARGFLQVAKIRHNGDWNVAPRALRQLLMGLNKASGTIASTEQTKNKPLYANDPNLFKYPVVYMHGRRGFTLSQPAKKQLRTYLTERGGLLFADACCGSKEFDDSFRELMTDLFADKNVKFKRIPLTHKLFTREVGFDIRKVKRVSLESTNQNATLKRIERVGEPYLEGIEIDERLVVIYSKYDISCAVEQQASIACAGYVRVDAMRIAINIFRYAMLRDIRYSELLQ